MNESRNAVSGPERGLEKLRSGPSSRRSGAPAPFERALLAAWSDDARSSYPILASWLSVAQCEGLDEARRRYAGAARGHEASRFLAHVFEVLPKPVLVQGPDGVIVNRAFERALEDEEHAEGIPRDDVLARFRRLIAAGSELRVPRLFLPLGERAYSVQREDFPSGTALYLSELEVALPQGPALAKTVALLKASGVTHKQIAALCGCSKPQIDRIASAHKQSITDLRASLCHAALR